MKWRIVAVIVSFFVVIGLGTVEAVLADKYLSTLESTATTLDETISEDNFQTPDNIKKIEDMNDYWDKKENVLCFMVIHNDIEELGKALTECEESQKLGEFEDFKKSLSLVIHFSKEYKHIFTLSAQNIF